MTLFKKVFQNQSRPATADEGLDEEALRSAFADLENGSEPLVLDPFEHGVDDVEDEDVVARAHDAFGEEIEEADADLSDDPFSTMMDTAAESNAAPVDEFEEEEDGSFALDALIFGDPDDVADETTETVTESVEVVDDVQENAAIDSEAEIAAVLDRAREAADPQATPSEPDEPVFTSVDDMEFQDPTVELGAKARQDNPEQNPVSEQSNNDSVAAFAQQQLASLEGESNDVMPASAALDLSQPSPEDGVPVPVVGRAGRRAGRVKTRLLGFNRGQNNDIDPFGLATETTASAQSEKYPVGWLVIVEGPGLGHSFSIFTGASMIGRGEDQVIRLDFGDNTISRNNHAAIAYDEEENKFYIGHGGKSNIIRRNARPVLSTEELHHADLIRIGETTLRFVALCGSDFQWSQAGDNYADGL